MKKSEIKDGVKNIVSAINNFRDQLDDLYAPIDEIKEHFEAINQIQEDNGLDCGVEIEDIERNLITNLLDDNEDYQEIDNAFDNIICDLEGWSDDVSDNKREQIQDDYIQPLEDIRNNIDLSEVFDKDTLDDMLIGILNEIDESDLI